MQKVEQVDSGDCDKTILMLIFNSITIDGDDNDEINDKDDENDCNMLYKLMKRSWIHGRTVADG